MCFAINQQDPNFADPHDQNLFPSLFASKTNTPPMQQSKNFAITQLRALKRNKIPRRRRRKKSHFSVKQRDERRDRGRWIKNGHKMALSALIRWKFIPATRERLVVVIFSPSSFFHLVGRLVGLHVGISCEMMNRFESLLKSNFFPHRARSLYAPPPALMKFIDTLSVGAGGRCDVKCTQKGAARICSSRPSINQRRLSIWSASTVSQPCSYYYHHRHYYYCDIIRWRDGWGVCAIECVCRNPGPRARQLFTSDTKSSVNNCAWSPRKWQLRWQTRNINGPWVVVSVFQFTLSCRWG